MKTLWFILLVVLVVGQGVDADNEDPNDPNELLWAGWDAVVKDPNDPNELLSAKWDAVIKVLQSEEIDQKVKEKIIDKIVSPLFDFTLMGKLALGRTHWTKLTDQQREKFIQLFAKRLKESYREKISLYTDEKAFLNPAIPNKNAVFIPMQLISKDKKIEMLYKLRKVDRQWKIYDVEMQGVSIVLTYRSQFNDILRNGTVKDVLSQLEKPPTR
jgi:phospholipid transport system substrate-binding protein